MRSSALDPFVEEQPRQQCACGAGGAADRPAPPLSSRAGGGALTVATMRRHSGNPALVKLCCKLLGILAAQGAPARLVLGAAGAVEALLGALRAGAGDTTVVVAACRALTNLMQVRAAPVSARAPPGPRRAGSGPTRGAAQGAGDNKARAGEGGAAALLLDAVGRHPEALPVAQAGHGGAVGPLRRALSCLVQIITH